MKYLIYCFLLGLSLSCSNQQHSQPTLSDQQLSRIMADLSVAEAATTGLSGYPKDSLMKVYFTQVFEIHGTTPEIYEKDLREAGADLQRLQQIVAESIKLLDGNTAKKKPSETGEK